MNPVGGVIGCLVLAFAVLLGIGWMMGQFEDKTDCTSNAAQGYAIVFVQDEAKQRLYAPYTADFGGLRVEHRGAGFYKVSGYVDSKNLYGGPIRNYYSGNAICESTSYDRKWRVNRFKWSGGR